MDRREQLTRRLYALNDSFAGWIREQHGEKRDQLWTAGLQDYISHGQELIAEFKDVLEPEKTVPNGGTAAGQGLFGGAGLRSAQPSAFPAFGGGAAAPQAAAGFSFGGAAPAVNGTANQEEDEGEADDGSKIQVDPQTKILFESRAALYVQTPSEDKAWSSRGRGLVTLRKPKPEGSSQRPCHLVFTTEAGRVLVNASLYAGLKPRELSKGRVLLSLPLAEEHDGEVKTEQRVILLKLSEEKAVEAIATITANIPQ